MDGCAENKKLVWFLIAGAVVLGALFLKSYNSNKLQIMAAFFTVLGDLITLLALGTVTEK